MNTGESGIPEKKNFGNEKEKIRQKFRQSRQQVRRPIQLPFITLDWGRERER